MASILTNKNAMQAVQVLNANNRALATTQNRLSTGLKVATARDDGATYAIAQGLRNQIASWQTVNESLNRGKSLLDLTASAASAVSDILIQMREKALALNDTSLNTTSRAALQNDLIALVGQIDNTSTNATFNGINLLSPELGTPQTTPFSGGYQQTISQSLAVDAAAGFATYDFDIQNNLLSAENYMDSDFSGSVSQTEMEAYFTSQGRSIADADTVFAKSDNNADGGVTSAEQKAYMKAPTLGQVDTGGNGSVNVAEMEAYITGLPIGATASQADDIFAQIDTNHNALLSSAEMTSYYSDAGKIPKTGEVTHTAVRLDNGVSTDNFTYDISAPWNTAHVSQPVKLNYVDDAHGSSLSFDASTTLSPNPNPLASPTGSDYGIRLNSITYTPIKDYKVNIQSDMQGGAMSLHKQPMNAQWLGLQDIATMNPDILLDNITKALANSTQIEAYFGNQQNLMDKMLMQNTKLIDSLNVGVGHMVDADMGKESATLQAQQTKSELATQTLSMANQAPNWILKLFK